MGGRKEEGYPAVLLIHGDWEDVWSTRWDFNGGNLVYGVESSIHPRFC